MSVYHWQIGEAEQEVEDRKRDYLLRWGWTSTCKTPGSYWLWKRDFATEDANRHARWKERGPGPQASEEDRAQMAKYFGGDGISDGPPSQYLLRKGWRFTRGGMIEKPGSDYKPSKQEWDCLYFLCDEWDYGYDG